MAYESYKLLTSNEVAKHLRIHPKSLARMRADGKGPVFIQDIKMIRYRAAAVEECLRSHPHETN